MASEGRLPSMRRGARRPRAPPFLCNCSFTSIIEAYSAPAIGIVDKRTRSSCLSLHPLCPCVVLSRLSLPCLALFSFVRHSYSPFETGPGEEL